MSVQKVGSSNCGKNWVNPNSLLASKQSVIFKEKGGAAISWLVNAK